MVSTFSSCEISQHNTQTTAHRCSHKMGCGASTGSPSEAKKLHSKIRWFNKDETNDEKQVRLNDIIALLGSMEIPDAQNGNVAIHIASQNGHFEVVDLLISKGAKLSPKNRGGNTRECLLFCVDSFLGVHFYNHCFRSTKYELTTFIFFFCSLALHMATEYDFGQVCLLLRAKGADPLIKNAEGCSAETGIEGTKEPVKEDATSEATATE